MLPLVYEHRNGRKLSETERLRRKNIFFYALYTVELQNVAKARISITACALVDN